MHTLKTSAFLPFRVANLQIEEEFNFHAITTDFKVNYSEHSTSRTERPITRSEITYDIGNTNNIRNTGHLTKEQFI